MKSAMLLLAVSAIALSGCAGLDFGEKGLKYYDPAPHLFVAVDKDCVQTATPVVIPGDAQWVKFDRGYGSAKLSVTLSNGMIASAGQETDAQVPATLTAVAGLATAFSTKAAATGVALGCIPQAKLYRITNGVPESTPVGVLD